MTIITDFPADNYLPGVGIEFDFFTGSRSSETDDRRMLIIGTMRSTGTATAEKQYQVLDEGHADTLFGIGSEVALMARAALATVRDLGLGAPEIYAIGVAEPGAGTAASGTFTITGAPTAAGEVIVRIAGRTVRAAVASGDSVTTIAQSLVAAINAMEREIPVLASNVAGVVTVTYRHKGTNGNDVIIENANGVGLLPEIAAGVVSTVSGANLASGAGVIDITNALAAAKSRDFWEIAVSNNEAADMTDLDTHLDETWATMTDQYRFAQVVDIDSTSAATTLAGADDERIRVASCPGARSLPCEIAAALSAMVTGRERPNYNHCGSELPLYGPDVDDNLTPTEQNTLIKAGVTPLISTPRGKLKVVRLVSTRTTANSVANRTLMDHAIAYTLARVARQIDDEITATINARNLDDGLKKDLKSVAMNVLRSRERAGWLQNVEAHKDEVIAETHPTNDSRVVMRLPANVVKIAAQAVAKVALVSP